VEGRSGVNWMGLVFEADSETALFTATAGVVTGSSPLAELLDESDKASRRDGAGLISRAEWGGSANGKVGSTGLDGAGRISSLAGLVAIFGGTSAC
jgi:hypothetical protein